MAEHFHALRVAQVVPETSEANSIRFEVPEEKVENYLRLWESKGLITLE